MLGAFLLCTLDKRPIIREAGLWLTRSVQVELHSVTASLRFRLSRANGVEVFSGFGDRCLRREARSGTNTPTVEGTKPATVIFPDQTESSAGDLAWLEIACSLRV